MGERKLSRVRKPNNARLRPRYPVCDPGTDLPRIGRGCREVEDFFDEGFLLGRKPIIIRLSPAIVFRDAVARGVALLVGVLRGADFLEPLVGLIGVLEVSFVP